jgi:hypothetical protein
MKLQATDVFTDKGRLLYSPFPHCLEKLFNCAVIIMN